jgi:sulfatase modifying factor 1
MPLRRRHVHAALIIVCALPPGCRGRDRGARSAPPARRVARVARVARATPAPTPAPVRRVRPRPLPAPPAKAHPPSVSLRPRPPAFRACAKPPQGMRCIPGGPFWRGSDKHRRNERPRGRVVISTFYMDVHEATNPVFTACVRQGLCRRPRAFLRYHGYHGTAQPAVPVSWYNALKICLLLGKRLPTEAEWEKAARTTDGRTYPWGNEPPTCRRAHYRGCKPARTRPVGSLPANPYGLFELAGNGYEWVMDWASPCYAGCRRSCGAACGGRDPRGPCAGVLRCPGYRRRVLRGGSWYWPARHMRTSWRRPEHPRSGNHRLSFRCVTRSTSPRPRTPAEVRQILRALRTRPLPL